MHSFDFSLQSTGFEELISLLNQPRNVLFGIEKDKYLSKNLLTKVSFDYIQITENVQLITINDPNVELIDNNKSNDNEI